ncbi:hypothetical protein HRbin23_01002 [bacterium HR23]|nr:hypothetical protein HRbin23_01002 [bacterium HR23]
MDAVVATVGTEPQVVTLVVDALLRRGCPVSQVVVVHTHPSALQGALERLQQEEPYYSTRQPPIAFHYVPIRNGAHYPADIVTEADAVLFLQVLYRTVAHLKRQGWRVHLSVAGGRKVMSAYGMVVAQLLLGEEDYVWHLLSEASMLRSRQMHAQGQEVVLVPVPVLRWSLLPSALAELLVWDDPYRAIQRQRAMHAHQRRQTLTRFWAELTPAEQRVVRTLVLQGGDNAHIGRALGLSGKTVANHLRTVYDKYRTFIGVSAGQRLRERLIADLASCPEVMGQPAQEELGRSAQALGR